MLETTNEGSGDDMYAATVDFISDDDGSIFEEEGDKVVQVNTFLGSVTGRQTKLKTNETVFKFLGIPYARPPIGNLRFKPPQPVAAYDDLQALEFGSICPQHAFNGEVTSEIVGNEDCLFLNIFTISLPQNETSAKLKPVMLWIHGGAFVFGSSNIYDPAPLIKKNVVVVTINYRLGGLGFLTFGNDIVGGNMGIRDQIAAVQWTFSFIQYFGGDPTKITIFGESAGAISVNAIQLSPKSLGLISGAIIQSGTMLAYRTDAEVNKPERIAAKLASVFNCTSTSYDSAMLDCLQDISIEDFLVQTKVSLQIEEKETDEFERGIWQPVVDSYSSDPVIPVDPLTALSRGQFNRVPIITGKQRNL